MTPPRPRQGGPSRLPATAALVAALSAGGLAAQEAQPAAPSSARPLFADMDAGAGGTDGFYGPQGDLVLATGLIGQEVYSLDGADLVGVVTDLVMGSDGRALALVVGVGGFLGIGDKDVAVDFHEIAWMPFEAGRQVLVMNAAADRLEQAPAFARDLILEAEPPATPQPVAPAASDAAQDPAQLVPAAAGEAGGTRLLAAEPQTMDGFPADAAVAPQAGAEQTADPQAPPITAEDLMGMTVFGAEGRDIGRVDDVLVTETGVIEALIIDAGGFLSLGTHRVAVAFDNADFIESAGMRALQVAFTEEELRAQTAYDADAYRRGATGVVLRR